MPCLRRRPGRRRTSRRPPKARGVCAVARILNLVLLLEYQESAFYADAVAKGRLRGELREFARVVGAHERAHVAFIRKALGAKARKRPQFDFGDATSNAKRFVASAIRIEDTNVGAYNGQSLPVSCPSAHRSPSVKAVGGGAGPAHLVTAESKLLCERHVKRGVSVARDSRGATPCG